MADMLVAATAAVVVAGAGSAWSSVLIGCTIGTAQPSNAPREVSIRIAPNVVIVVMLAGISTRANELHPAKAEVPMLATDDGIVRFANELHPLKAEVPMLVTDDGIATLANELHPLKT